ncbi:unnamed protein product [Acanthoscelides obtectus]|uniref:Uncharacterized protein n=1 Tax=Acanthoscelides obtectus TaxID=200917 RepID=A0A9P0Q3X7_ACAOB|nr:unnamed protein product [Acanthoscelides obtectus]CAH2009261.1 unnamed protein product [Acanthoscelides obtectus]CAK1631997.1 hypothetical protein AOBTE_LOCUS7291 [Acanthoscelides obtectus]CAK1632006.1 hypothetical protein AOBTE_LOCUS7300 [Acanthoscelides obtectus]
MTLLFTTKFSKHLFHSFAGGSKTAFLNASNVLLVTGTFVHAVCF